MTATEFRDAIRPFVTQYMQSQKEARNVQGISNIHRVDSNTKGQVTRVVNDVFGDMTRRNTIEYEVYL